MSLDDEMIEVNVDDLLDVVNAQRRESAEQKKIDFGKMLRRTVDDFNVIVDVYDLLSLGVKPSAIFDVVRQR